MMPFIMKIIGSHTKNMLILKICNDNVNRDLYPNVDEVDVENQIQQHEIKPSMYIL